MDADTAKEHIDGTSAMLVSKGRLLLTVEVKTPEAAEQLIEWMYATEKPMKSDLLEISWDKVAVPTALAEALAAIKKAFGA